MICEILDKLVLVFMCIKEILERFINYWLWCDLRYLERVVGYKLEGLIILLYK